MPLSPSSALPPQDFINAVTKYISRRTSYFQVRLAFYPYPQFIPALCTVHGFGPPSRYYRGFNLTMGSSPGFGSNPDNTSGINEIQHANLLQNSSYFYPKTKTRFVNQLHRKLNFAQFAPYSDSLSLRLRNSRCLTLRRSVTHRLILQ